MADKECAKCIHNAVCKTAESCDGNVPGCNHFEEEKLGRWIPSLGNRLWNCSECMTIGSPLWKRCPVCEAKMPQPPKGE